MEKGHDAVISSARMKKTVSWDPLVEDNEGRTVRKKKKIKENENEQSEVENYFQRCIPLWHWDQKVWDGFFDTVLNADQFKELIDQYGNQIKKEFRIHFFKKYCNYDLLNDADQLDFQGSLDHIVKGYIFLIGYYPNFYNVLSEYQDSLFTEFPKSSFSQFYNEHPELTLIRLIENKSNNVNIIIPKGASKIMDSTSGCKTGDDSLVDNTNYDETDSEFNAVKLSKDCNASCKVADSDVEEILNKPRLEAETSEKNILNQLSKVSTGEQPGTSGVSQKKRIAVSPKQKDKFNPEYLEGHGFRTDLQVSASGCFSTRISSKMRLKRDLCEEHKIKDVYPYEPMEDLINETESSKISARLYLQISHLVALEHPDPDNENFKPANILTYATNIGDIISEREINHSLREQELLQTYYREALEFWDMFSNDTILDLVGVEIDDESRAWLFDNGKQTLLVSYDGKRFHIYSPELNYRQKFHTNEMVRFQSIELYAKTFFKWCEGSIDYELFTLKRNIPGKVIDKIKQAKFWNPVEVVSDLVLIDKGSFSNIEGIPARTARELFFLDGHVPELSTLHEDFFTNSIGRISFRINELHNVLPFLDLYANKSLVNLVKHYNFWVDTAYINNVPEITKSLMHTYHGEVNNKLSTSESITIQDLSDLSWQILDVEMSKNPEVTSELREEALQNVKELHSVAATQAYTLGITSHSLFFLPEIVRLMDSDDSEGSRNHNELRLDVTALNEMYDSLVIEMGSVLSKNKLSLLKKLPYASPTFKILTIHFIIELHKGLNGLKADSDEACNIRQLLEDKYLTIGLMVADLSGFGFGPSLIRSTIEQLVYGATELRRKLHCDIQLSEAFLINIGFKQNRL